MVKLTRTRPPDDAAASSKRAVRSADTARNYRVVATAGVFEPGFRGGGPIRSLRFILDTLPGDLDVTLITRDRDLHSPAPYPGLSGRLLRRDDRSAVFYLDPRAPRHWVRLIRHVRSRPIDLLYVNSIWSLFSVLSILVVALRLVRVGAILVAPRGELSPGALAIRTAKKRLFLAVWAPLLRRLRVRWQACSGLEEKQIRANMPWAQVMVNGNESPIPEHPAPPARAHDGPLRLVFVGRISPMKNLSTALEAVAGTTRPMEFDIFGPPEDPHYWSRCQRIIAAMPGHVRVRYLGELAAADVLPTFSRYDAFLFPTLGENFGHVILESLASGCPVVCSDNTPFSELIADTGGLVVRPATAAGLSRALDLLAARSPEERAEAKGTAGRRYRHWRQRHREPNVLAHARQFCR
ncbi:Glycosyltransferase involved in cell wall bisynthesis [Micromonospora matsumotoense]|uniref:Glycosyltransferase involved in cell wall bisynthesis n=1 Tax=Micromonospora matsumotoense TaxID=121616 RepID=A0A1C4YVU1_9ACTN|nr:glycosyltransferase family 4 protein [Micromonospora matsumotoense]SCF24766.1 Glycosyltransferase involved in cell wall bisynthesis [Micromonospora matsumotoense]